MSAATADPPHGLRRLSVTPPLREYIAVLWRRRAFAISMSAGEFRARHANTFLGSSWNLLNPLLQLAIYWVVFGLLLQVNRGVDNFIGFLAAGIFIFQFSQKAITGGAGSITKNLNLIRSLQFPRALLPISAVLREAMGLRLGLLVAAIILLLTGEGLSPRWLLAVPVLALQFLFNLGGAFITARLADRVRDIENVLPFVFRLAFYGSGVLFLADRFVGDLVSSAYKPLFLGNPLYCFISLFRHYTMTTITQDDVAIMWISASAWSIGALVVGILFFRAAEGTYGRG